MKLSIIIPAYNEGQRIEKTLLDYSDYFSKIRKCYEIIVVCDDVDRTANIVKSIIKDRRNMRLLEFKHKSGKGAPLLKA